MTAREVLLKAAEHIERYGWRTGTLGGVGHPCCVRGAIAAAIVDVDGVGDQPGANALLVTHLGLELPVIDASIEARHRSALYIWNDAPGRTKEEVIAALRGAAERAV